MARLKTRLAKLEQAERRQSLTRAESALLVSVLARRDALFWPWRYQTHSRTPLVELRHRRQDYLAGRVGIAAKADGREQWKDAHAMRQNLIAAGHITATHSSGQVQSVFLTPLGEATARALVGDRLHAVDDALPVLVFLHAKSRETSAKPVRESVLFNRELLGSPSEWDHLTELMLPLLTSGMVTAETDTTGRTCYVPVDDAPDPVNVSVSIEADPDADAQYVRTFNGERAVLERVEPRDSDEILVPLPATGWGLQFKAETDEEK